MGVKRVRLCERHDGVFRHARAAVSCEVPAGKGASAALCVGQAAVNAAALHFHRGFAAGSAVRVQRNGELLLCFINVAALIRRDCVNVAVGICLLFIGIRRLRRVRLWRGRRLRDMCGRWVRRFGGLGLLQLHDLIRDHSVNDPHPASGEQQHERNQQRRQLMWFLHLLHRLIWSNTSGLSDTPRPAFGYCPARALRAAPGPSDRAAARS